MKDNKSLFRVKMLIINKRREKRMLYNENKMCVDIQINCIYFKD